MGRAHSLSGAVTGLAAGILLHKSLGADAALSGFAAGGALLPDLDAIHGSAARCLGFFSMAVAWVIRAVSGGHRHLTHAAAGVAVLTLLAWGGCELRRDWAGRIILGVLVTIMVSAAIEALTRRGGHLPDLAGAGVALAVIAYGYGLSLVWAGVLIGASTHLLGDSATDSGVPLLLPFSKRRFHLWPEPFAFTTGSAPELLIVTPLLFLALLALALTAADPAAWGTALHLL